MSESVENAMKRHVQLLADLKKVSSAMSAGRIPPLDPLPGNRQVQVWQTERGAIERLRKSGKANGIVMRDGNVYHIFIDEDGDPSSTEAIGRKASDYFLIYHEYAHILHHDVFEDDPERIMKRRPECRGKRELLANGYAAEKTTPYVLGPAELQALKGTFATEGWIGPSNPYYEELVKEKD